MSKQKRNKQRNQAPPVPCTYCGEMAPPTGDHVFARTLFKEPRTNPIKMPVCQPCRTKKNRGETTLRDLAYFSDGGVDHPDSEYHLGRTARATRRRQSLVGQEYLQGGQDWRIVDGASGRTLKRVYGINTTPEIERLASQTVRYIIRGLYAHHFGRPLPALCPVLAGRIEQIHVEDMLRRMWRQAPLVSGSEGVRVAQWDCWVDPRRPLDTSWVIVLGGGAHFQAWTGDAAIAQAFPQG